MPPPVRAAFFVPVKPVKKDDATMMIDAACGVARETPMFLGIEIGGTKLQLGLGAGDGVITALWRGTVNPAEGSEGIRKQIVAAVPELLAKANLDRGELRGIGIGFGGPTDDATQTVIKSHHIAGLGRLPASRLDQRPRRACRRSCATTRTWPGWRKHSSGQGRGCRRSSTSRSAPGVGGGLIIDGQIYRGAAGAPRRSGTSGRSTPVRQRAGTTRFWNTSRPAGGSNRPSGAGTTRGRHCRDPLRSGGRADHRRSHRRCRTGRATPRRSAFWTRRFRRWRRRSAQSSSSLPAADRDRRWGAAHGRRTVLRPAAPIVEERVLSRSAG